MAIVPVLQDTAFRMAFDYAGVTVFAATGALAAARKGYDLVTFAFFAAITGIGGGTLRDLLIGAPVFWVANPGYIGFCIAAAGAVWAIGERLSRFTALLWLDAVGLAAYCVIGASKAADWGAPPLVAVVMGVLTASFGGIVRDVLASEPSVLLRKEIYVTAAVVGAGLFVITRIIGVPDPVAAGIGMLAAFGLRAGAIARGWTLPGYAREIEAPAAKIGAIPTFVPVTPPAPEPVATAVLVIDPPPAAPKAPRKPRAKPVAAEASAAPAAPRRRATTPGDETPKPKRPRKPKPEGA